MSRNGWVFFGSDAGGKKIQAEVLPKSPEGRAVRYTLKNWTALTRYCEDGDLEVDNNATERAILQQVVPQLLQEGLRSELAQPKPFSRPQRPRLLLQRYNCAISNSAGSMRA